MANPMTVLTETWAVAADPARIWLLDGRGPWLSGPVMSDDEPHSEVEYSLSVNHARDHSRGEVALLHSTSWRVDGQSVRLTYMAVIDLAGKYAVDLWPHARPVSLELAEACGRPLPHLPTEAPWPRAIDVMFHGLKHLRYLADTNDDAAATFDLLGHWRAHLDALTPALAGMYRSVVAEAEVYLTGPAA